MTISLKRVFALLVILALCGEPLFVLAQVEPEATSTEPVIEEVVSEPETAYDPSMPGEILATSTVAVENLESEESVVIDPSTYVAGEVIVQYEGEETPEVVSTEGDSVPETIEELSNDPDVAFVEPNFIRGFNTPIASTTDTYRNLLWGLENNGQTIPVNSVPTTGTIDADTDASEAWDLSTGTDVIVAVIDSGVDYTHEDLAANMWDGTNCVDDTGTALGGCIHGYDFENNDKDPMPIAGNSTEARHGTHVAGTIAAVKNNAKGVIGIAPNAKIMAIRFGLDTATEVQAIDFARENGARIINASFSGSGISAAEQEAIQRFTDAGGIFVASAGNGAADGIGDDLDNLPDPITANVASAYPAQYDNAGIISVAATTQTDTLADFSNFGHTSIDLSAPGVNTASTFPGNSYGYFSGTSMAAPHVAGALALLAAYRPDMNAALLKQTILDNGDTLSALSGKTVSGKRLNAYGALVAATLPPTPSDTTAPVITLLGDNPLNLAVNNTFTDPGATVTDNVDATSTITGTGVVDTSIAGTYVVTYNATDAAGNAAISVTRDVIVSAPTPPEQTSSSASKKRGGGGGGSGSKKVSEPSLPRLLQNGSVLGAFTSQLTLGSSGAEVTQLQNSLTRLGFYSGPVTGYFGALTVTAVKAFQSARGIPATGIVDLSTRTALNGTTPTTPQLSAEVQAKIALLLAQVEVLMKALAALKAAQ